MHLHVVPDFLKAIMAGVSPSLAVIAYFCVWDRIHFVRHHAEYGDVPNVMTPMAAALILGSPIYLVLALVSFLFANLVLYARR